MIDDVVNNLKFFLVLEKRPGDYAYIDIYRLNLVNYLVTNNIMDLDNFTLHFTEAELKDAINKSNMVTSDYLDGNLRIVSNAKKKHNLKVLSKDIFETVIDYLTNEEYDKNIQNKLISLYYNVINNDFKDKGFLDGIFSKFKNAVNENNAREVIKLLNELPYLQGRNIYFSIYDEIIKFENDKIKILEKANTEEW